MQYAEYKELILNASEEDEAWSYVCDADDDPDINSTQRDRLYKFYDKHWHNEYLEEEMDMYNFFRGED